MSSASFLDNPQSGVDGNCLLHELFEASARRDGARVAVECHGETLAYHALETRANQLAHFLRNAGIARGSRVCLLLSKSLDLYVAILGTLKAGAAYVPLDPTYPEDRVRFIAADSGAALLLTSLDFLDLAGRIDVPTLFLNEERPAIDNEPATPPAPTARPDDVAYVIYTSGSTGKPKGVLVTHLNATHLVRAEQQVFDVRPDDRVLQGFSVAFDASVEEVWAAFNAGATLVAGTPDIMQSGPDLGRLLSELNITVLSCVPALLAVLSRPVPSIRLLILGGEVLPDQLVTPWFAPERRIYNTYGPTETTVVATLSLCQPEEKVTIGRPLANYTAYILGDRGELLARGLRGELVIGGPGVTKGYQNRPDLTEKQFIANPFTARTGDPTPILYRTGDLARINDNHEIEYLGRVDTQVKIRGFRVELAEIEAVLRGLSGVRDAVVLLRTLGDHHVLGAYVLPAPGATFDEAAAVSALKQQLPPYMVPVFIEPMARFPTLPNGKTDREGFPLPTRRIVRDPAHAFDSPLKTLIYDKWVRLFGYGDISETDDFFLDLGGHSLIAAEFVSEMRQDERFADLSMTDLYAHASIGALAAHIEARGTPHAAVAHGPVTAEPLPAWKYWLSACVQVPMLYVITAVFALQWITPFMLYSFFKAYEYPFWYSLSVSFGSLLLVYPVMLLVGIGTKWLVLGRLAEGDYPIWGAYYLRWLLVQRMLNCVPLHFLAGTPLLPLYLRLLGSRIGRDAYIDSHLVTGLDLLHIGTRVTINADANVSCYSLEDGYLRIRRVRIADDVCIGIRSVVGQDVAIGEGTVVDDHTCIRSGQHLGVREHWSGSPAVRTERAPDADVPEMPAPATSFLADAAAFAFYAVCFLVLPAVGLLPIFPGIILMYHFDYASEDYTYLLLAPVVAVIFVVLSAVEIVGIKWLLLGKLKAGTYRLKSVFYMRKWVVDKMMEVSLELLQPLYATLYVTPWYRALGVKVGSRAEVSTAAFILPDLLEIGEGSFIADGAALGPAKVQGGQLVLAPTTIGARTFIGNRAFVPLGAEVGSNCLLGVQTRAALATPDGTAWVGSPALHLPQRQKPAKQFAAERTYHPTGWLYCQRLLIELFRVILPATAFVLFTTLILSFSVQLEDVYGPVVTGLAFPALYVVVGVAAILTTATAKQLLIGRYTPDEQPLWSPFVWRTELMTAFCENFTDPFFVEHLQGTVFLPWHLRLLGMHIGRRACLMTLDFTEFDLVTLGDDVAINDECTIQTHLFEDRVMKMSTVQIGSRVSIGSCTVILYGTVIEDGVKVGDLSLLMKGERLYRGTEWAGAPVQRCTSA